MQTKIKITYLLVVFLFLTIIYSATGTLKSSGDKYESLGRTNNPDKFGKIADDFLRHRRSVLTDVGYGSRLQAGSNIIRSSNILRSIYGKYGPGKRSLHFSDDRQKYRLKEIQRIKQILSEYVHGYRLQESENIANSFDSESLASTTEPTKSSFEINDVNKIKNKRLSTDYGYGSRLQAGRNLAKSWGRNELFGTMGPGKRSYPDFSERELAKRIVIDLGYGSRSQAAENAAKLSNGDLFGTYGPGKRSVISS
jgi:hypothetical protein